MRAALAALLLFVATVFGDLKDLPPAPRHDTVLVNGCVLYALEYKSALQAKQMAGLAWARVLRVHFKDQAAWHAYLIFKIEHRVYAYAVTSGTFEITPSNSECSYRVSQALQAWENQYGKEDWSKKTIVEHEWMD